MAKECFCGCGRKIQKFPVGTRAINTRGKQVSERLAFVDDEHPHLKEQNEGIAVWVKQGYAIRAELVAAMHGETDPGALQEGAIREWQAEGRHIERFINEQYAQTRSGGRRNRATAQRRPRRPSSEASTPRPVTRP